MKNVLTGKQNQLLKNKLNYNEGLEFIQLIKKKNIAPDLFNFNKISLF